MERKLKIILSGGGTGGHIYPAVAVAEALQRRLGDGVDILFVGAEGKMEMEKVPALGYRIEGLPVAGLQRRLTAANLLLPYKVIRSVAQARRIVRRFGADAVVGFGGYASAPVLWSAQMIGVPTLIQEQNSYAGVTNKILGRRAKRICVAYDGMERFFPKERIGLTGNPLRGHFGDRPSREEALAHFNLAPDRPVVLVVGGSLGTRTLNNMMKANADRLIAENRIQAIWQTGKYYQKEMDAFMAERNAPNIWHGPFIERMDLAYAAADVVVARAGAGTVSELCLVGRPTVFVPSPNVAEDHQTKNAMALVRQGAARMVADREAVEGVFPVVAELLGDADQMADMKRNMLKLGIADSADRVVNEILNIINR